MKEGTLSANGAMSMYKLTIYRMTIKGNEFSMNGSHLPQSGKKISNKLEALTFYFMA
jgi:hypothetical protein